ncbi:LacI family DNA-binding transcriptional regulator [Chelativorans sp. M5D2P16]|uniref:LacI family DNA-binding transcriptional regulator n=1 Tax=Chelativorans sp. M5D2P16 TaxID=3095678 RepID=UPI002ACA696C|nr:LacI family DNA-binding transcriptional regulator [Chelativorans sp. M5D2P16]MDZ5700023.1 LacI family DNA-binding transcriptional regulator [Chelativorans sp. M5D2P16]
MGRRPTIADLAQKAGVSVATVDRVLNGRHRVREETARRVYEAAEEIGYHATALIRQRITAGRPKMDFAFLLQKEKQPFYQAFGEALQEAADAMADVRVNAHIEYVANQTPTAVAERLEVLGRNAQAIAATSLDHHAVTQAVDKLKAEGKPVFSLLSDFAQGVRESYVGLNNLKVGRMAAWLISRTAPRTGKVAIFVGSHRWHGHELRETGFRSYFREYAPQFEILETLVNMETRQVTYEATLSLLDRHPDIAGFYVAGGGMEGAIGALRDEPPHPLPAVVVNELTPDSAAALQEHLIVAAIATPLPRLCRLLLEHMASAVRNGPSETPGQIFLSPTLHVPESL